MNIFRLIADMLHLAAILLLLYRMKTTRNCVGKLLHWCLKALRWRTLAHRTPNTNLTCNNLGISCKTQEIYLIVFCVRYMDLFLYFVSVYNTVMKIFFIGSTALIVYLMRFKKPFCSTYDAIGDAFPHLLALLPAATVLAIFVHAGDSWWECIWSWSLWLEALAFIP